MKVNGVTAEAELLLCCARTAMDSENSERIKDLTKQGLDWGDVLRRARSHGMLPLLYWNLHSICPESVPLLALEKLRDEFHANSRRNLFLVAELLEVLRLLQNHGITAIPYKGPVLAASIYGNVSLRQFSDLDIFVRRSDALQASDLLLSRGYGPRIQLSGWRETAFLNSQCEFCLVRADASVTVDVHWEIVPRRVVVPIDLQQLWQRLVPVSFAGTTVFSFPPEDLLLILCIHGTYHCWERLDWICGISELTRRLREIKWPRVLQQAEMLGCRRMLFLGLFLAHRLLGANLSGEIQGKIEADRSVLALANQVRWRFLDRPGESPNVFAAWFFHVRARERLRDKINYNFRLVTTLNPNDWEIVALPANFRFLYYVIRVIRLITRHRPARAAWARLGFRHSLGRLAHKNRHAA